MVSSFDFVIRGSTYFFKALHTFVPEALRGQNIAGRLTRFALDDVRQTGKKVRPQCSYTQLFLRRHPEYAPLQAEGATPAPACALPRNR